MLSLMRLLLLLLAPAAVEGLPIRLICSDVDGTLLTPKHTITERTAATILRAMELVPFAACTGRGRAGAYNALGPVGVRLRSEGAAGVFLNGLVVYGPGDELILDTRLPGTVVLDVAEFASEHGASLVGYSGDRILCSARDEWTDLLVAHREPAPELAGAWPAIAAHQPLNKLIVLAPKERVAALRPLLAQRLGDSADLTQAIPEMLEVLPVGGSKGAGVRALLAHTGIPAEATLAIGDAENDLGMLELAGVSVAMGNAPDAVKATAQHVSATNAPGEDGGAAAIERFVLRGGVA